MRSPAKQRLAVSRISPSGRMRNSLLTLALYLSVALFAAVAPTRAQTDPASLPAHDSHQSVVVGADPYVTAARYKDKFGKHTPYDAGILALEIFVRNDNDKPIRVNL